MKIFEADGRKPLEGVRVSAHQGLEALTKALPFFFVHHRPALPSLTTNSYNYSISAQMDGPDPSGGLGAGGGEAMLAADRAAAAPSMSGQHRDVAGRGAWIVRAVAPAEVNRLVFIGSANENDTLLDFLQTGA